MAAKKLIKQVLYPGHGDSAAFKTVAFTTTMTVAEACAICATKGGLKDKMELYGLCIKDTSTWLKEEDTLASYPTLEHCVSASFSPFFFTPTWGNPRLVPLFFYHYPWSQ
jgi:hypothetical protein